MATPAPSCVLALSEATKLYPDRSRASDGILGDARHAGIVSDHNDGNAFDLTHDPAHGCDAHRMVRLLVDRRDPRVKYAISQRRIWSAARASDGWRPYTGTNPHTKHAHVSIYWKARDDLSPWWPELREVRPMFDPPLALRPIVAAMACPTGGAWLLADDGSVYAFGGAPYHGDASGEAYFVGRKAAKLEPGIRNDGGAGYVIVATSVERYGPHF